MSILVNYQGQKQRVAIARALAMEPDIMLSMSQHRHSILSLWERFNNHERFG